MGFFFTIFYQPVANTLFALMNLLQVNDLLIGILALVVIIRVLMLPLFVKSTRVQIRMKNIAGDIKNIQKNTKDKKVQAEETIKLYKKAHVNPFAPILFLLIQIPIFLSVFFVIRDIGEMKLIQTDVLYGFVNEITLNFQSIVVNLTDSGGIVMALLVGITQFFVIYQSQKGNQMDAKHGFTLLIVFTALAAGVSFFFIAAIGVYWLFNNILSLLQEVLFLNSVRAEENAAI